MKRKKNRRRHLQREVRPIDQAYLIYMEPKVTRSQTSSIFEDQTHNEQNGAEGDHEKQSVGRVLPSIVR